MNVENLLKQGLVDYLEVDTLQRKIHQEVLEGTRKSTLIVSQFNNVYTAGSKTKEEHLCGLDNYVKVDRGGSITWHGQGQLVIYPVVKLKNPSDVILYIRTVEKAVLAAIREEYGLNVETIEGKAGVWLRNPDRKICAIGLKVANGVTLHGLALNVNPNLDHFSRVVPCGLYDCGVSSLESEGICDSLDNCAEILLRYLSEHLEAILDHASK
ncbi:lipoyl(octanoyl) transferase LipB [Actinomyces sp. zg-332]|uniref:lipoyl(octanoyl) transferase LipB n=1 Tax=Actinomyces sp. zg-332 TaxID=2708340 RepID=UPI00141E794E|nr:lipoyl(octanoyl) transferase LipB [Actinomyces sp. zg-332]QPK94348.1 lipoyl(octanoyl) transferase LipB [Actinomyces sp. zg-332]